MTKDPNSTYIAHFFFLFILNLILYVVGIKCRTELVLKKFGQREKKKKKRWNIRATQRQSKLCAYAFVSTWGHHFNPNETKISLESIHKRAGAFSPQKRSRWAKKREREKKNQGSQANRKSRVRDCVSIDKINWIMIIALG